MFNAQRSVGYDYQFDYLKLRSYLERAGDIQRGYFVNSVMSPIPDGQARFHNWLKTARPHGPQLIVQLYELKDREVTCTHCGGRSITQVQKGVDVGIATLMVRLADQDNYDTVILSSGDGDYLDAVRHIKEYMNKRLELCVFELGVSPDLQAYADRLWWINDFHEDIARTEHPDRE